jgi:hypothetical protein
MDSKNNISNTDKFSVGTKVVPHTKSIIKLYNFGNCPAWNRGKQQGFLYVKTINSNGEISLTNSLTDPNPYTSSYHIDDIILYEEPNNSDITINSIKVGKIYENKHDGSIYYVSKIDGINVYGFGFFIGNWVKKGTWIFRLNYDDIKYLKEASETKWLIALVKECDKRGLIDGVEFNSPGSADGRTYIVQFSEINFDYNRGCLLNSFGCGLLMKEGDWARPVKEPKEFDDKPNYYGSWAKILNTINSNSPIKKTFLGTKGNDPNSDVNFECPFTVGEYIELLSNYICIPKGIYKIKTIENRFIILDKGYQISFENINLDIMKSVGKSINDSIRNYEPKTTQVKTTTNNKQQLIKLKTKFKL